MPHFRRVPRKIDQVGKSAYQSLGRKYALIHKRQVTAWKAYSIVTFVAGLAAASIWLTSSRFEDNEIVIKTRSYSQARSEEGVNSLHQGKKIGRADDRILVKFKKDVSSTKRQDLLKKYGLKEKSELKQIGVKIVSLPPGKTPEQAVEEILDGDGVAIDFVEVDAFAQPAYVPNDPYYGGEWHISKTGVNTAWDGIKGDGVTIAILDSGVDCDHPDLTANCVPGWNVASNNSNTADIHGHGTAVATTAAAVGDNAIGYAGVAYRSKIMPIRLTDDPSNQNVPCSNIANGILYTADHGVKIASNSYWILGCSVVVSAADYLASKGGVYIRAAGNNGVLLADANDDNVIIVSATDSNDVKTSWSNYGPLVDVAAPGTPISCIWGGSYTNCWGTSFSVPIIAGTVALMKAANMRLTTNQVKSILYSTAKDLGATGRDDYYGYGRVDAAAAVAAALNVETDALSPTAPANLGASLVSSTVALTWTASSDNVGVAQYIIYRDGNQIGTTTKLSYSDTTVSPEMTYTYTVKAIDTANNISGASNTATVTVPVPTLALTSATAKATSATTAAVSWTTNIPASGSLLEYGTSATNLVGSQSSNQVTTSYSANLIGLMKKTRYYYRVTVTSTNGEKIVSNIQSFTTRPK